MPLYKRMITAGNEFAKTFSGLSKMRISFRNDDRRNKCLQVADCLRERYMFEGSGIFFPDDDQATRWLVWETSEDMQDSGSLEELLQYEG